MSHRFEPIARWPSEVSTDAGDMSAAPSVLDAQALARLAELDPGGRSGLVERVLTTYEQSLRRLLEQVRAARVDGDRDAIRHTAHTLKSSSTSVGALALGSMCAEVESCLRDAPDADPAGLADRLDRLVSEGERVLRGLGRGAR